MEAAPDILDHNLETVRAPPEAGPQAGPLGSKPGRPRPGQARRRSSSATRSTRRARSWSGSARRARSCRWRSAALRDVDCDILTIGQYLRPTPAHLPLIRYVHPDEFEDMRVEALELGFRHVESGPLVRSSYRARDQVPGAELRRGAPPGHARRRRTDHPRRQLSAGARESGEVAGTIEDEFVTETEVAFAHDAGRHAPSTRPAARRRRGPRRRSWCVAVAKPWARLRPGSSLDPSARRPTGRRLGIEARRRSGSPDPSVDAGVPTRRPGSRRFPGRRARARGGSAWARTCLGRARSSGRTGASGSRWTRSPSVRSRRSATRSRSGRTARRSRRCRPPRPSWGSRSRRRCRPTSASWAGSRSGRGWQPLDEELARIDTPGRSEFAALARRDGLTFPDGRYELHLLTADHVTALGFCIDRARRTARATDAPDPAITAQIVRDLVRPGGDVGRRHRRRRPTTRS